MKDSLLLPAERIDDLQTNGLKIIQSHEVFSFSLDAVLLARFCSMPKRGKVMDLCTGNGVIPLLLSTRSEQTIIYGIEIQQRLADMAQRSVELNRLSQRIHIQCADLKNIHEAIGFGKFDLVTANPPYLPVPAGEQNSNHYLALARHELSCNLEDVIMSCAKLVKAGGKVALVHRPARLTELCHLMHQHKIEPKRLRFVHARADRDAMMVLIEGMKDAKSELRVMPPFVIYDNNQQWNSEIAMMYQGKFEMS